MLGWGVLTLDSHYVFHYLYETDASWNKVNFSDADVDAAKQLLADAGYPDGFEVELRCPNDRYVNDEAICTAVVGMLGKIGVKVSLFAQTKSKHFKELKDNQGDFYMLGWGVPTLDSHYVFHYLYETGASWNKVNFSNAEVDAAIRVMEGEVNLDKRNAAIANAWKIVKDNIAYLPLHHLSLIHI